MRELLLFLQRYEETEIQRQIKIFYRFAINFTCYEHKLMYVAIKVMGLYASISMRQCAHETN